MANEDIKYLENKCKEELQDIKGDKFDFYYDNPSAAIDTIEYLSKKILELIKELK